MNALKFLFIFILLAVFSISAFSQLRYEGKVAEIIDGKTVVLELLSKTRMTVEIEYIEIPEPEQEFHQTVKEHLQDLLLGKAIEFRANRLTTGKTFGQIYLDGVDISEQMIRDGAAWYAISERERQDPAERQKYMATEQKAKIENRGIWSILTLKPAWEFRAEKEKQFKASQLPENVLDRVIFRNTKIQPVFGQPRYQPEDQQQSNSNSDGWSNIRDYNAKETVNLAGLISKYIPGGDFGYLSTTALNLKSPIRDNISKMAYRVGYFYRGSTLKTGDDSFLISVFSQSKNWKFAQSNSLTIVADGQVMALGNAQRYYFAGPYFVQELLLYKIRRSNLAKIINAKKTELKVGKYVGLVEKDPQKSIGALLEYSN